MSGSTWKFGTKQVITTDHFSCVSSLVVTMEFCVSFRQRAVINMDVFFF
jgi:hypothetical protein